MRPCFQFNFLSASKPSILGKNSIFALMKSVFNKGFNYLKEPYPFYYNNKPRILLVLTALVLMSFGFSYLFEPFDVNPNEHKIAGFWILVIHASLPFPIAYSYLAILNSNVKDETFWTLGKEIFHTSMILLLLGLLNFAIRDFIYDNPNNWSLRYLWEEIRNTFLVGFLLISILIPLQLERLISKHKSSIPKIDPILNFDPIHQEIAIQTLEKFEDFKLNLEELLFAKVESNYTEIISFSSNKIHKKLIRIPLKDLEEQLKNIPFIIKTHRSYLVNLNQIIRISGNAQGYQLTLKNYPDTIPVARAQITGFNQVYAKR